MERTIPCWQIFCPWHVGYQIKGNEVYNTMQAKKTKQQKTTTSLNNQPLGLGQKVIFF